MQNVNNEIVGISEEIISLCEKELEVKLSEGIHVSLPDHINFAKVRIEKGVKIENLFSVKVSEDEIGYIALHISRLTES